MVAELFFTKLAMLHDTISDFEREYGDSSCCTACVAGFLTLVGWLACLSFYVLAGLSLFILVYTIVQCSELGTQSQELSYYAVLIPQSLAQIWLLWWFVFDLFSPLGFGLCRCFQIVPCLHCFFWQWWVEETTVEKEPAWRVADTAHANFGMEVPGDVFGNEEVSIVREDAGLLRERDRWVALERVPDADLENWV
eukprot:CAMPEP_0197916872 /NCGR_PEP_ID=MMETSP1439-20131203/82801_1 /TAXON_ID=66791 /ORGANISM="Gonyaulax spinifera, Strain CCMP409" /LENGTH=194 /DNA_ID=CAMNT_0043538927 /DNA_START=36 /DNA_END=617 /DNA_ORIENTATION=+